MITITELAPGPAGGETLLVGPSLGNDIARQRELHSDVEFRAPAACGDILRAVEDGASAIGLVDGYFGDLPSVWHKEILYALEQGIAIGEDFTYTLTDIPCGIASPHEIIIGLMTRAGGFGLEAGVAFGEEITFTRRN